MALAGVGSGGGGSCRGCLVHLFIKLGWGKKELVLGKSSKWTILWQLSFHGHRLRKTKKKSTLVFLRSILDQVSSGAQHVFAC